MLVHKDTPKDYLDMPDTVMRNGKMINIHLHNKRQNRNKYKPKKAIRKAFY